jgi:hypothetical protein
VYILKEERERKKIRKVKKRITKRTIEAK